MISLGLAEKLKDSGLRWEPKDGDFYLLFGDDGEVFLRNDGIQGHWQEKQIESTIKLNNMAPEVLLWLPSLSDLLSEIERRGYGWDLDNMDVPDKEYNLGLFKGDSGEFLTAFIGDTPEEAAGKALLWIMEQEAKNVQ